MMKSAVVVLSLVAFVVAEPPSGYGLPSLGGLGLGGGSLGGGGGLGGLGGGQGGGQQQGGQVYRHVYVHAAPDLPEDNQARVIRVPGGQDKHVNIIFVKTPSQSSAAQTELILPDQNQQKTIVYVLHKQFNAATDLKIRRPLARQPAKPEVYFIRYKNQQQQQGGNGGGYQQGGGSQGSAGISQPSTSYGL